MSPSPQPVRRSRCQPYSCQLHHHPPHPALQECVRTVPRRVPLPRNYAGTHFFSPCSAFSPLLFEKGVNRGRCVWHVSHVKTSDLEDAYVSFIHTSPTEHGSAGSTGRLHLRFHKKTFFSSKHSEHANVSPRSAHAQTTLVFCGETTAQLPSPFFLSG